MEVTWQKAGRVFEELQAAYQELIYNPEGKLEKLKFLQVGPIVDDNLRLEFFGKVAEIRFSMVISKGVPKGQATFTLIQHEGTPRHSERQVMSLWFDRLGNVRFGVEDQASFLNVKDYDSLHYLAEEAVNALLNSEEFMPASNMATSED